MLRFGIREYIRNFWFNFFIIVILLVMMLISTVLVSKIDDQTGPYRLAKKYMDEDSMFLSSVLYEDMDELKQYGELLAVRVFDGSVVDMWSDIRASVYPEEVTNELRHRLDPGTYSESVSTDDDRVHVLISHNPYGIKEGDTFTYEVLTIDGKRLEFQVYVDGVLSEGQRLYTELHHTSRDMTYEDFFPVYSYEQTEQVRMIIPERELKKVPEENIFSFYCNVMINPEGDLTEEERNEIWKKIKKYDFDYSSIGILSPYPKAEELVERNRIPYKNILMTYLPLCIIIILLFSISVIGVVIIKTEKTTRCYGSMNTYGKQYWTSLLTTELEMVFNCVMAFMVTVVLFTLQKIFHIVDGISFNLDTMELVVLAVICVVTIVTSVFTISDGLKKISSEDCAV